MQNLITKYCEKNPITIYADYRDEIPQELVKVLLEKGGDSFTESACEYEWQIQDSWYEYGFSEYVQECATECELPITDELKDIIQEHLIFDFSDFWKTAARNTRLNIALIPINPETGEYFDAVHWELDFSENLSRARALNKYFGIRDYKRTESMYSHESLKIMGRVDLWELIQQPSPPELWTITPQDRGIFHTSWNGSGCLGEVNITKTCAIKCDVRNDSESRYGIQAVYGFTNRAWDSDLTPVFKNEVNPCNP